MFRGSYGAASSGSASDWHNRDSYYSSGSSVSLFKNALNTNVIDSQINVHVSHFQGLHYLGTQSAMGALHDSLERQQLDAPRCHPNTRDAVINRLIGWIIGDFDLDALILWLYGAAGAGKSAIARTLAEICKQHGWLLATFFFWKTAVERNNVERFVATIAYQIAHAIPALRSLVEDAVNSDPMVIHQSVDTQLSKLIVEPLRQLKSTGFDFTACPFVIIVDGLDECQGADIQSGIVKSLDAAFHRSPLRIRILIASRPEVYLQSTFSSSTLQFRRSQLALSDEYSPDEDIHRFLQDSFERMKAEHPLASYIPSGWPAADILRELTRKSSGQFIFASTVVKYIGGNPHELPTRRLDVIRRLQPPRDEKDLPYAELNSLYHHVLSKVSHRENTKKILGVLLILDPLLRNPRLRQMVNISSPMFIDELQFWQPGETIACLSQLASLIRCDGPSHAISVLHATLSDFLLDHSRSLEFYLCRDSILGDCAALALRHLRLKTGSFQHCDQVRHHVRPNPVVSSLILKMCLDASTICTPALGQEFGVLSFQNHYNLYLIDEALYFWYSSSSIFEMLHNQNLQEKYPQLVSNFTAVCLRAFTRPEPDKTLTLLVFIEQCSHLLGFRAPDTASAFSMRVYPHLKTQIRRLISKVVAVHTQRPRFALTGKHQHEFTLTSKHYLIVAQHFMGVLRSYNQIYTLCPTERIFNLSANDVKEQHSNILSALLCIAHALPLACRSEETLADIFPNTYMDSNGFEEIRSVQDFHGCWTLDGWNDGIIQPARNAVLNYYERHAQLESDVEAYKKHLSKGRAHVVADSSSLKYSYDYLLLDYET